MSEKIAFYAALRNLGATKIVDTDGFVVEFAAPPAMTILPARFGAVEGSDFEPPEEVNDPDEDMRTLALYSAR